MSIDFKRITLGNILSMTTILGVAFVLYADIQVMKNDIAWVKDFMMPKHKILVTADK